MPEQRLWCCHQHWRVIAWIHLVHAMNAEERQMAVNLWTNSMDLSHWKLRPPSPFFYYLLLSLKADTQRG